MIQNVQQLRVTMEQMERLLHALEDLRQTVLPKNPQLFATLAEAPLDDLQRLRSDVDNFIHESLFGSFSDDPTILEIAEEAYRQRDSEIES